MKNIGESISHDLALDIEMKNNRVPTVHKT